MGLSINAIPFRFKVVGAVFVINVFILTWIIKKNEELVSLSVEDQYMQQQQHITFYQRESNSNKPANYFTTTFRSRKYVEVSQNNLSNIIRTLSKPESQLEQCPNILKGMTKGKWLTRNLTNIEEEFIMSYLEDARSEYFIPTSFEREDGLCGDKPYEFVPEHKHMPFRSICNSRGSTPCCYTNKCVSLPMEKCRCPTCYDERQAIHSEFATWKPDDDRCQVKSFVPSEACKVLKGYNITFVGDSFLRHVFVSLVIVLTDNTMDAVFKEDTPEDVKQACSGMKQITGLFCRDILDEDRTLCNGTVRVRYKVAMPARDFPQMVDVLHDYRNQSKSLLIFSVGIHDNFNTTTVIQKIVLPSLNLRQLLNMNQTSKVFDLSNVVTNFSEFDYFASTNTQAEHSPSNLTSIIHKNKLPVSSDKHENSDLTGKNSSAHLALMAATQRNSMVGNITREHNLQRIGARGIFLDSIGNSHLNSSNNNNNNMSVFMNEIQQAAARLLSALNKPVDSSGHEGGHDEKQETAPIVQESVDTGSTAQGKTEDQNHLLRRMFNDLSPTKQCDIVVLDPKGIENEIKSTKSVKKNRDTLFVDRLINQSFNGKKINGVDVGVLYDLLTQQKNETVFQPFPSPDVDPHKLRPHMLWFGIHSPGLLKGSKFKAQTADGVKAFNRKVENVLSRWKIPYLQTFSFTKGVVSFDGTHYGWGINMLKVDMLLTYVQELNKKHPV